MSTCQTAGCGNPAQPLSVYDANPNRQLRRVIGQVWICPACQDRIDQTNSNVR